MTLVTFQDNDDVMLMFIGIRVLESLPCLHDKVLAAAIEAVISSSQKQRKKQGTHGSIVNILKGFKGGKAKNGINFPADFLSSFRNLDKIFSKNPFPDPVESITDDQEDVELDIGKSVFLSMSII